MLKFPIVKANLTPVVLPGEGVLLLSENGASALHGQVYEWIVPLLDGRRSTDEIVDALANRVDGARVYYALMLLEKNGHVAERAPDLPRETTAFWQGLDLTPNEAIEAVGAKRVRVRTVGEADATPIVGALQSSQVVLTDDDTADFEVAVTDDYLRATLHELNAAALKSGRPWLLVRLAGHEPWIGPLFVPGKTACYACLKTRLGRNRAVHRFVAGRQELPEPPPTAVASLPAIVNATAEMAAIETLKFLAGAGDGLAGKVLSMDTRTWTSERHTLVRHPACPACGQAVTPEPAPLSLVSRTVRFAQDGGHRSVAPEKTLKNYEHLVSPITGVVTQLVPAHEAEGIAHVYLAGHNHALTMDRLDFLKRSLRNASSGKGMSETQAKASALCEAIERYSGEFTGSELRIGASYRELRQRPDIRTIHPNAVMNYSEHQYAERAAWNARKSKFNRVPESLDESAVIDWSPVWSLTHGRHAYLPTQLLYYRAPAGAESDQIYCMGCSNGNASGNNLEEAVLQGFFELVERDAVALWWYNRLKKPGVDAASFGEPYLLDLAAHYAGIGRQVWALDVTSDLGIPVFVAVSRLADGPQDRLLFGLGCHFDARLALQRAFAEMNQMLGLDNYRGPDAASAIEDEETRSWLDHATLANQPYFAPDDTVPRRRREDFPVQHSGDLFEDILRCRQIVEERGMEVLVLDQTRPDVGMPVVKVIVPGLRHFWARFAPGRLYDVPVRMGWLDRPLREEDLNPIPVFF